MAEVLPKLLEAINHGFLGGRLAGVTVRNARLPDDRLAEYRPLTKEIVIDERRAGRRRGGVVRSLVHECAHALTPHLLSMPSEWHNAEFQRARCDLALRVWAAEQRYARRRGKETKTMNMGTEPSEAVTLRHVAQRVEIRRPGALSVEEQLRRIRTWAAAHPDIASIKGVKYTVDDAGRVRPRFDTARPSIRDLQTKIRARAARW